LWGAFDDFLVLGECLGAVARCIEEVSVYQSEVDAAGCASDFVFVACEQFVEAGRTARHFDHSFVGESARGVGFDDFDKSLQDELVPSISIADRPVVLCVGARSPKYQPRDECEDGYEVWLECGLVQRGKVV
jgi:hypothetical protein